MQTAVAHVLVVDGNLRDLIMVRKLLSNSNAFEVVATHEAARALQLLREREFDAIVVDQALQDRPGVEFLRLAVEGGFEGAVIFTAAEADRTAASEALRLGAARYLVKPPSWPTPLPEMLVRALERARLMRQNREFQQQNLDIQQQNRVLQQQLDALAQERDALKPRDDVTGLYREWYFEECRAREAARAQRLGRPLGVIELRITNLPRLHAIHGSEPSAAWIQLIGNRIARGLRTIDVPAHLGDGRFKLLLLDCDRAGAGIVAARLQRSVDALKRGARVPAELDVALTIDIAEPSTQSSTNPAAEPAGVGDTKAGQ